MSKMRTLAAGVCTTLALCVLLTADERPLAVEPVASPAGANSSAPQLTVEGDRASLSWIERSGKQSALKFAERTATGWSEARVVVSSDHRWSTPPTCRRCARCPTARWPRTGWRRTGRSRGIRSQARLVGRRTYLVAAGRAESRQVDRAARVRLPVSDGRRRPGPRLAGRPGDARRGRRHAAARGDVRQRAQAQPSDMMIHAALASVAARRPSRWPPTVPAAIRNRSAGEIRDIYVTRLAAGRWTMPVPVHRDNSQDRRLSRERSRHRGPRQGRRRRLVHRTERDEPVIPGVFARWRQDVRRAGAS